MVDPRPLDSDDLLFARPGDLLWTSWPTEGCYGLFDRGTGLTHLLNDFPAAILHIVDVGPMTHDELSRRLAHECGVAVDAAWQAIVEASLIGLIELELIDRQAGRFPITGVATVGVR